MIVVMPRTPGHVIMCPAHRRFVAYPPPVTHCWPLAIHARVPVQCTLLETPESREWEGFLGQCRCSVECRPHFMVSRSVLTFLSPRTGLIALVR